jgi:hypothetical protein
MDVNTYISSATYMRNKPVSFKKQQHNPHFHIYMDILNVSYHNRLQYTVNDC